MDEPLTIRVWECCNCSVTVPGPGLELATVKCKCGIGAGKWAVLTLTGGDVCEALNRPAPPAFPPEVMEAAREALAFADGRPFVLHGMNGTALDSDHLALLGRAILATVKP